MKICKNNCFNIENLSAVFDTYVNSVLSYGAEVLGFHKAPNIEPFHVNLCKRLLGLRKSTCNSMVYHELGRYPMIIKYWIKLRNTDNCILKS